MCLKFNSIGSASVALLLSLLLAGPVEAEMSHAIETGVDVSGTYDSNVYNYRESEIDGVTVGVAPTLAWRGTGQQDELFLAYVPVFSYFDWTSERSERQVGNGGWLHHFSQYVMAGFDVNYTYYDGAPTDVGPGTGLVRLASRFSLADSEVQREVADILFPDLGIYDADDYLYVLAHIGERYVLATPSDQDRVDALLTTGDERRRRNLAIVNLMYEQLYGRDSLIRLSYNYENWREKSSGFVSRDIHSPQVTWQHWFNEKWQVAMLLGLADTDFVDNTADLTAWFIEPGFIYTMSTRNSFTVDYRLRRVNYQDGRDDLTNHELELGWIHHFTNQLQLDLGCLGGYDDRVEPHPDEWRAGADAALLWGTDRGAIWRLEGGWGYGEYRDSADQWLELRNNHNVALAYDRELWQDISSGFRVGWEWQEAWEMSSNDVSHYVEGLRANFHGGWTFWDNWHIGLDYTYYDQQGDLVEVLEYQEHLATLRLTWLQEIMRY